VSNETHHHPCNLSCNYATEPVVEHAIGMSDGSMTTEDPCRFALQLIGTSCETYTGWITCISAQTRSPYARYGADRWCDRCIARTALEGDAFPEWGASGVEERPLEAVTAEATR
jgi:hypothetical protein